jgi:glycosyltransferase involved in cell wall biosynthesis
MMNIGYGINMWSRGLECGHLDGIGVYSRELYHALNQLLNPNAALLPMGFGQNLSEIDGKVPEVITANFISHVLQATLLNRRVQCKNKDASTLFHATDHHIPALSHTPVIATVMDIIPLIHPEWVTGKGRSIKNWFFKKTILSADHLITISEYSKRDLIQYLGLPEHHISVTPLGVNPVYFDRVSEDSKVQILAKYNLQPGFFLFVGTLQPRKNLEALLDAHAQLSESLQKRHPLVVVGQVGWKMGKLLATLEQRELEGKARWLKYLPQSEVMALLQSAKALTYLSLYEGFGLPVVEAFAAQCPVIASNTTSIPEIAGEAAYLVDPTDHQAMMIAMLEIIENEGLGQALISKGVERARVYSWETCAKATFAVYKKVLNGACIKI